MNTTDPNRMQTSDYALLIQLLGRMNTTLDAIMGLQQSSNATLSLLIEQTISMRGELKTAQKETLETRAFRSDVDIQSLEAKDREYAIEMQKIRDAQEDVRAALETMKSGRGQTQEKMKAIAIATTTEVISADKIDIRGIKVSSKQFTYILIGLALLLAMLIIFLPDSIAEILTRLAGMIGNGGP